MDYLVGDGVVSIKLTLKQLFGLDWDIVNRLFLFFAELQKNFTAFIVRKKWNLFKKLIGQLVDRLRIQQENEHWAMECRAARVTGRNW